ncbi:MAG: choice-of-anchor D domain-containing protein [Candidatus Cloacimonetes bacterium]|nr:choice-of-anchor D domain-containing protein [Candidatus Cloacimonadota bacterium]
MKKVTLLFALLIFSMALLISQNVSEYTFSTITTGSLEDMSSGTTPILGPGSYYDDTATAVVDFGFTFTFAGTGYNQFSANSNGQMRLGGTVISTFPNFGANVAYLYPFSGDNALMATGQIHYKVVGSAPNRKLVVEWLGFRIPYGSTGTGSQMQVWLHETTNRVDYVYGNMYANSSTSRGICIANSNVEGSIGNITNIITTPTWTPTGTSVVNTSISLGDIPNLNSTANGSRRVFTWEPPVAGAAPNPALCISPINGATDVWINPSLNWSSGGGLPNGYKVFFGTSIPGTPNATQAATTWNTGMLQYSTTYYWQIIPYNDFGDAADCPVWSFTTMNDPTITAFPYVQNFDAVTAPALPLGWTALDNNGDADIWQTYASNPHSAPNAAMIYTDYNSTNDDYLITPPVVLTGNQRMKFWTRCQSTGEPDEVAVLLSSTTPSAEAFTLVALASTPVNYTTYAEITVDLSAYSGTHYIAFARRGDPADGWRLYVDDVRIEDIPTAPIISVSPTAWDFGQTVIGTVQTKQFTVGNIGSGTLTLSNISVSGSYFSVSVNPAPVSLGPDESTTFTVQYAPLVAGTHEGTVTITDNRAITTIDLDGTCFDPTITAIPYTQTFEVWPPAGWDLTGGTYSFAQYTAAGNNWARANYWGQPGGNTDIMTTPLINPGEATRIQFTWSHLYNSSYPNDALTVQVSSDYVNWTDIWSRSGSTLNSNDGAGSTTPGTGVTEVLTIPVQFQSGAYFVRFYGYSGYGPDLFIDNFVVEAVPQAPIFEYAPTTLPFGGVAENASSGWQNVTVMNTGGGTLNLVAGNLSLTGTNADQFAFNPANLPAALANGQSVAIPVQFNPTSQGEKTATLRIDYSGTYYDVALSGTGMPVGTVVIGTGTNIGPVPSYPWYTYTYSQSIYLQGEINTPNRRIESLWWYWNGNSTITEPNMDIYMGHTTLSEFSGSFVPIADHTLVFSGPFTVPASAGWVEFPLITPFMYNNTDNLIITANENGGPSSTYYSQSDGFYITPAATLRSIYSVNDSAPYVPANMTTGTTYSFYPNVMLILGEVPVGTPGHVTLNTPANGATMIDPDNTTLTWAPDGATAPPAYYQIFVGSEPIDPANEYYGEYYYEANGRVAFNLSEEEDIELTYNSRWYWAVLPVGGDDSTPDPQDENFMVWNFRIQPPPPQISVNPMSLTSMVDFGETDVQNITISNTGGLPLDYSIGLVEDAMRNSQIVPIDQYVSNPQPMRRNSSENAPYMIQNLPESVRALFDLQFAYDCSLTNGEYGIATDGQYIYVSRWSGTEIYKYSLAGTYIETLTVTDYPRTIRDLT